MGRRFTLSVFALSLCLVVAGCGSGPNESSGASTSTSQSSSSTTSSSSGTPGGSTTACTSHDLTVIIGSSSSSGAEVKAPFLVRDGSSKPCTLSGYFGLALVTAHGQPVGPSPAREAQLVAVAAPPAPIVLGGQSAAEFLFQWAAGVPGGPPCPSVSKVELTAPDQMDSISIPAVTANGVTIAPCASNGTAIGPVTAST